MTTYTTSQMFNVLAEMHHMTHCDSERKRWFDPSSGTICDEGGGMYWDCIINSAEWQKCQSCNSAEFERKAYEKSLEIPLPHLTVVSPLSSSQSAFVNALRTSAGLSDGSS